MAVRDKAMVAQGSLVAVAVLAVAALALVAVASPRGAAAERVLEQASVDAALAQLLSARSVSAGGMQQHQDGRTLAKARMAMRTLERNLQGELSSVKAVLARTTGLAGGNEAAKDEDAGVAADAGAAGDEEDNAKWEKRTMQRGAMRGESTQKQLAKVMEKDLSDHVAKDIKWKMSDLKKAVGFADYLKSHPLPDDSVDTKPAWGTARLLEGGETVSGKKEDDGIIKVTFKREMSMTDKQYRELENALAGAGSTTSPSTATNDNKENVTPNTVLKARLAKVLERAEAEVEAEEKEGAMQGDSRATTHKLTRAASNVEAAHSNLARHPHPEMWTVPRSEGEEVRRILEKVLGVGKVGVLGGKKERPQARGGSSAPRTSGFKYVVQSSDQALATAGKRGRKWAEDEVLREHGNFVHLPPRHADLVPLAVQPYYWCPFYMHQLFVCIYVCMFLCKCVCVCPCVCLCVCA
jgi:hypothetical protein